MDLRRDHESHRRFGAKVNSVRKSQGMSKAVLAAKAETSRSQVSQIVKGEGNPTLSTILRIAAALDIDVQELFIFD
jgi:transcriptional regulator with XRE-family HTH domain